MRAFLRIGIVVALAAVVACSDDAQDSIEASYARASCERTFACSPQVRRNFNGDTDSCVGYMLAYYYNPRLKQYGEACAEATLDQWACEGQAACDDANFGESCDYAVRSLKQACPGVSFP